MAQATTSATDSASRAEAQPADPNVDPGYRLAVFSQCDDRTEMAETLADALGLNRIDARVHASHLPGVLSVKLSCELANAAAEAVRKLGIAAAGVAQSDLLNLDHPIVVHHAACLEEGLEVFGLQGVRSAFVPWSDLEFVSVGHVPLETAHHYISESLVVIHSAPHSVVEEAEGLVLSGPVCWLIARNPQRIFFINHARMNYDYLGERKAGSASVNFGEFLNDVVGFAENAFLTPSTRAVLNHGSATDYSFSDPDRLKQTTLMQYLLHRVIDGEDLPAHE